MPLINAEEIKKIYLPSSKDQPEAEKEFVVMDVSPLKGGDMASIEQYDNPMVVNLQLLAGRVREWNVKDAGGNDAEVSKDNVARLPMDDLTHLLGELNQIGGDPSLPLASTDNSVPISVS